jgi:LPXTG-site transpeptidase (sortase) family protein
MAPIHLAVTLVRAVQKAMAKKWSFLGAFFVVFFITTGVLAALDVLPNPAKADTSNVVAIATSTAPAVATPELPSKIEIPSIKLSVSVSNPDTTDVAKLDQALLTGAVRYPTSSELGQTGNVIIFGHSSYLPIVHNQAYKTFDGIQNLHAGDQIMVYGTDRVYVYSVQTVVKADAAHDAIPLSVTGNELTLATCDSFGTKSDRFIVTATLVGSNLLGA